MRPTFHHRLVNGPFGDPALFVRMLRERRALLFDAGDLSGLDPGDLHKVTHVFISHMHIDHFIGLDTLLRANLHRGIPLSLFGPEGIIECVEARLRGYTWNIIQDYPLAVHVTSIDGASLSRACFSAADSFRLRREETLPFSGTVFSDGLITVRAAVLSHGIPCMGYALEEPTHINIDKAALAARGLEVGPWLGRLKMMIRDASPPDTPLPVCERVFPFSDLQGLAMTTKGQKISYLTDLAPTEENLEAALRLVRDSDVLYCEAFYREDDRKLARERKHLTARAAGFLARTARVRSLVPMHISQKYQDLKAEVAQEALAEFQGLCPVEYNTLS